MASALARRPRLAAAAATTDVAQAIYALGGLRFASVPPAVYRALLEAPALVARKLGLFARIGSGGGATTWVRTEREPDRPPALESVQ